jgi:hypothetical protein
LIKRVRNEFLAAGLGDDAILQLHTMRLNARLRRKPGATPTFEQWSADWLAVRPISFETADAYDAQLHKHLLPEFGRLHLGPIDRPAIDRFIRTRRRAD